MSLICSFPFSCPINHCRSVKCWEWHKYPSFPKCLTTQTLKCWRKKTSDIQVMYILRSLSLTNINYLYNSLLSVVWYLCPGVRSYSPLAWSKVKFTQLLTRLNELRAQGRGGMQEVIMYCNILLIKLKAHAVLLTLCDVSPLLSANWTNEMMHPPEKPGKNSFLSPHIHFLGLSDYSVLAFSW